MKLFRSDDVRDALDALIEALEAEAAMAGETVKTVVVTSFTEEDDVVSNTAVYGCDCAVCLERARRSVLSIIKGRATLAGTASAKAH